MSTKLKIGLFGFGCVGQGLYDVLSKSPGFKADILKICVKDKTKRRSLDTKYFTFDKEEVLNHPEINLIVELIDDADEAYHIVTAALKSGKNVVTANKKMVASHLKELVELQEKHNVSLLYEASSCGSIPIIRTLEEYYDNELLHGVCGIFNGTSNYILSKTINESLSYEQALKQAQELGFAETDPTNDVEGFDPKYKAIILAAHAFGVFVKPEQVLNFGITTLKPEDINYAREKGLKIKLVPVLKKHKDNKISIFVAPYLIPNTSFLYNVENEYNGVIVEGAFSDKQFLSGKGAGGHPTGAAVLSDISALSYNYRYEYKKFKQNHKATFTNDITVDIYLRYQHESSVKKLGFTSIYEQYKGRTHSYVVGKISLQNLLFNRTHIFQEGLFFSLVSNAKIELFPPDAKRKEKEEFADAIHV